MHCAAYHADTGQQILKNMLELKNHIDFLCG